jgi:hypothetical protein
LPLSRACARAAQHAPDATFLGRQTAPLS